MNDAELVLAFRAGNIAAFATLIERHRVRAVNVARGMTGDAAMAEDVAQEATYQAYFEIGRLREPARFGAWLCGIAVNVAKMALRRRRFEHTLADLDGGRHVPDGGRPQDDPELAYEMVELQEIVHRALRVLTHEMRAAIWLHYVEGMSYQEVSALTGIPAGRLRVLSYRARLRLREELAEEWRPRAGRRNGNMIEVDVHDLRVVVPPDFQREDRATTAPKVSWVVVLKSPHEEKALCIWIGANEGESLAMQMSDFVAPRPQTYTLMANLVDGLGATIVGVDITGLTNDTFIARVRLELAGKAMEIDARPSDALNLAKRAGCPIFVAEEVWARTAFDIGDDLVASAADHATSRLKIQFPAGTEWRSGVEFTNELNEERRREWERIRAEMEEKRGGGGAANP